MEATKYPMQLNGIYYNDAAVARRIYESVEIKGNTVTELIDKAAEWMINNCENVHTLNVENILQSYLYKFVGVLNESLSNYINELAERLTEEGKIKSW